MHCLTCKSHSSLSNLGTGFFTALTAFPLFSHKKPFQISLPPCSLPRPLPTPTPPAYIPLALSSSSAGSMTLHGHFLFTGWLLEDCEVWGQSSSLAPEVQPQHSSWHTACAQQVSEDCSFHWLQGLLGSQLTRAIWCWASKFGNERPQRVKSQRRCGSQEVTPAPPATSIMKQITGDFGTLNCKRTSL